MDTLEIGHSQAQTLAVTIDTSPTPSAFLLTQSPVIHPFSIDSTRTHLSQCYQVPTSTWALYMSYF